MAPGADATGSVEVVAVVSDELQPAIRMLMVTTMAMETILLPIEPPALRGPEQLGWDGNMGIG